MKGFKKILALVLVAMMAMGMVSALAEITNHTTNDFGKDIAVYNGGAADADAYTSLTFKVWLNDNKPDSANRPKTKFHYTIAAGEANADKGIAAGTVSWITNASALATDEWNTVNSGKASDIITLNVNVPTGTSAGIYRYTVTQTALSEAQIAIGAKNENSETGAVTKYLDLYVNKDAKLIGAVLFSSGDFTTKQVEGTGTVNEYSTKVDGFHNTIGDNTVPTNPDDPDNPPTDPTDPANNIGYNVELAKTVSGYMGSKTQDFPFQIKVTIPAGDDETSLEGYKVKINNPDSSATTATEIELKTTGQESTVDTIKLKADQKVILTGVPATVTLEVKETVDAAEGYTISSTVAGTNITGKTEVADTENLMTETAYKTKLTVGVDAANVKVTYNNNREAISPTGLVLRYAPYFAMFAAGVALFIILGIKRRKNEEE